MTQELKVKLLTVAEATGGPVDANDSQLRRSGNWCSSNRGPVYDGRIAA